ncbi:DUF6265 family protein [Marinifilum flexuosum]|uniref:DUF6265 domain-containing protein n=1 Tax=Marinifilum flexuosum TaxID=1117708 RepID=A0A419X8W1_9BACT|nr:DUF6265 family protein [Marinifilum flexuosum]RKE04207.1 hypothetical protein BXY64_1223 [Marinifilum flexuosum]
MKYLILILFSICAYSCSTQDIQALHFLEGTWQVEGKQQFEKWEIKGNELIGTGYKLKDGKHKILEHLAIKLIKGKMVYQASVLNQNQGATIYFPLNESISDYYSFENPKHDFPKKIQYFKLREKRVKVNVLGDNDEGFSFVMIRMR